MPPMTGALLLLARGGTSSYRLARHSRGAPSSFATFPPIPAVASSEGRCHPPRRRRRRWSDLRMQSHATTSSATSSGRGFGRVDDDDDGDGDHRRRPPKIVNVPLVFVPGMKGTHLAFAGNDGDGGGAPEGARKKKRVWLTLGNLLNFPPRPDDDPSRDLSLPLTYDHRDHRHPPPPLRNDGRDEYDDDDASCRNYPRQHRGKLAPDGIVDHIIEFNVGGGGSGGGAGNVTANNFVDLNFLPFYGHVTRMLRNLDGEYHSRLRDGKGSTVVPPEDANAEATGTTTDTMRGIFDRVGSFVELTSSWSFSDTSNIAATAGSKEKREIHHSMIHCRPTAVFSYDWRRPLPELCTALHQFCEDTFPNQPVQIVAHSLGGLMTFAAMREHPEKYSPGAVVVGVPFGTGIQYFQDLHKGYFTELDRCRQFTPDKQFTMSSHWSFFPTTKEGLEDRFVDVTGRQDVKFDSDKSGIGKKAEFQAKVDGDNAWFEFYSPDEWERLNVGVFGPEYDDLLTDEQRQAYKDHMRIQMAAAKRWRRTVLGEGEVDENLLDSKSLPPLVTCASDAIPTVNQILRRRRTPSPYTALTRKGRHPLNPWEYDYVNGRAVPGDGRIDFDKAFPPSFVSHKRVALNSAHAKQMCWEENGGSWETIYREVVEQAERYLECVSKEEKTAADPTVLKSRNGRRRSLMNRMSLRARNARTRFRQLTVGRPKR